MMFAINIPEPLVVINSQRLLLGVGVGLGLRPSKREGHCSYVLTLLKALAVSGLTEYRNSSLKNNRPIKNRPPQKTAFGSSVKMEQFSS
jgi:hypothetical protein